MVVADEPILLAEPSTLSGFTLFGQSGNSYDIDSAPSLSETESWQPHYVGLPLSGEYRLIRLPEFTTQIFLRARRSN